MQVVAAAAAAGDDPEAALAAAGVRAGEGAVVWLTPAQHDALTSELRAASAGLDGLAMEAAAYYLADCLLRARLANGRAPPPRRR